jgi:hypothetical protein
MKEEREKVFLIAQHVLENYALRNGERARAGIECACSLFATLWLHFKVSYQRHG